MSQNQEIIEAKLCAYIDDELDAAGRAELEKHLAANPQHQRLIEELRLTSGLVRSLPRESAPPELAEGFNAHLERSVLLEGVSADVAAADLKVPRLPQMIAMAAITLLTVGLAVVVYFALPSGARPPIVQVPPHTNNTSVAMGDRDNPGADDQLRAASPSVSDKRPADQSLADAEGISNEHASNAPAAPSAASAPTGQVASANALARFERRTLDAGATTGAAAGENAAPVVLVMHADDPAAARKALVIYLVQQNIAWDPAPAPAPVDAIGEREAVKALRRAREDVEANRAGPTTQPESLALASPGAASGQLDEDRAKQQLAAAPARIPATQPVANPTDFSLAVGAAGGALTPAASQPAVAQQAQLGERQLADGLQSRDGGFAGGVAPSGPVFSVSCRLSAEQAEALRASLQQPGTSIDPLPAPIAPIELGLNKDALGRENGAVAEQNAPTPLQSDAKAAPSAAAELPTTNPSTAPSADVVAAVAAPAPALPAASPVDSAPVNQPSDLAASAGPATQPAGAATALLDVVIVVRPNDLPAAPPAPAPAAPATQP